MNFLSVCSGIEAASVAWSPLGWKAVAFSEIEPFPCAVLAHHYPDVPNHGDMTRFQEWPEHAVDLLCGGTPCQSFSVAGLRKGLADPRGNLMLTFGAIAARYRPRWLVWENVPGVLSSNGGRDFGAFLGMLGQLGYGFAYRVLDAQYFGLAQRRKRVFVVGCLGDWRSPAAVLFERHSLQGNPAPSREAGQSVAGTLEGSTGDWSRDEPGASVMAFDPTQITSAANRTRVEPGLPCHTLAKGAHAPAIAFDARQSDVIQYGDKTGPLDTDGQTIGVLAFSAKDHGGDASSELAPTLRAGGHAKSHANAGVMPAIAQHAAVRRLTPRECERLQGFPDNYSLIPYRGKPAADGPRYKALGNSWAVPVVRWIGSRIDAVDAITAVKEAA